MNKRLIIPIAGLAIIVFTFQNCGRSGFETAGEDTLLSVSGVTPTSKQTSPVAFDVGLDAIAYNSCVPSNRQASGYATVRATASGPKGGARLTQDFLTSAAGQLIPILGNPDVLDIQYKQLLESIESGAEVQASFRSSTDLQATYTGTAPNGVFGQMDYLSHDSWLTPLVDSARRRGNAFTGYSARAPSNKARFDFSFSQDFGNGTDYFSGLLGIQGFRACVTQGCQGFGRFNLAVGFSEPSNPKLIRGPSAASAAQSLAYGRGYLFQFGPPKNPDNTSQVFIDHGNRAVKGIVEYDLRTQNPVVENGQPTRWTCTEIPIMSPLPRGQPDNQQTSALSEITYSPQGVAFPREPLCNPMSGNFAIGNFNNIDGLNLAKVRELLPSHSWQLGYQNVLNGAGQGVSRLCAIPVGFDCYPSEPYQRFVAGQPQPHPYYVSYFPGQPCINEENLATELTKTGTAALNRVCGHYISVCIKQ